MSDPTTAPVEVPATIPIGQAPNLRAFEEARAKGLKEIPNPAATPADDTPDPEIDSDPELKAAVDEIEPPKPEETPAEKAARTRRHKEAAKLSAKTRYKNQRDQARAELEEWRTGRRTPHAQAPSAALNAEPVPEPASGEQKPSIKDFPLAKYVNEDDPYAAQSADLAEAVARWGARDEHRKAEKAAHETRQRAQAERDEAAAAVEFNRQAGDAKALYPDYDAVVGAYTLPKSHPLAADLFTLVTRSDVGAHLAYHLGKNPADLTRLMGARDVDALKEAFYEIRADVKAALKAKPAPASPKVTSAAEPLKPVTAAAGTGAVTPDPKTMSLRAWEEHRAAGGRR